MVEKVEIPMKKFIDCANKNFFNYICGKLLGDGTITMQRGRKPRFQFIHSAKDYEWAVHCFQKLSTFLPLNPPKYKKSVDSRVKQGFTESYYVQSRTADLVTYLESIWYKDRKKVLPMGFINKYLDEKALSWWYQDDGHLKKEGNLPRKIILSTDNFTNEENQQLIKLLQQKFCLYFHLDNQNRLVIYDQPQIYYFYRLIQPYMHQSMYRKMIAFSTNTNHEIKSKRTTIYLPEHIKLLKPTNEINSNLDQLSNIQKSVNSRESYLYFYKNVISPILQSNSETKSYQIIVDKKHWKTINEIRSITGLNNSNIIQICFLVK